MLQSMDLTWTIRIITRVNVSLNAHTHEFAYHPRGTRGNNFPVIIGGGYQMDSATVMILSRKGSEMRLKVIDTQGNTLLETTL